MRPIYNIETKIVKHTKQQLKLEEDTTEEETNSKWSLKSVRNLINVFEQRGKSTVRSNLNKLKSKSYVTLSHNKNDISDKKSAAKNVINMFENSVNVKHKNYDTVTLELDAIKQHAIALQSKISNDPTIDNKQHISYQNQIIGLLGKIGTLESNGNQLIKQEKQKCLRMVQNCNTALKRIMQKANENNNSSSTESVNVEEETELNISKVQYLKNIFENKKATTPKEKQNNHITEVQSKLITSSCASSNNNVYVPYSEYIKQFSTSSFKKNKPKTRLELSKSCENISNKEFASLKSVSDPLKNKHMEDITVSCTNLSSNLDSPQLIMNNMNSNALKNYLNKNDQEPHKKAEIHYFEQSCNVNQTDISVPVKEDKNLDEPSIGLTNGHLKAEYEYSSSEEDSDVEDGRKSSGFYSFVGENEVTVTTNGRSDGKQRTTSTDEEPSDQDSDNTNSTIKSKKGKDSFSDDDYRTAVEMSDSTDEGGALVSNVFVDYQDEVIFRGGGYKEVVYNHNESSVTVV